MVVSDTIYLSVLLGMSSGFFGLTEVELFIMNQLLNEFEIGSPMHHLVFRQIFNNFTELIKNQPKMKLCPPLWKYGRPSDKKRKQQRCIIRKN